MSPTTINTDAEFCGRVPLHQTNLLQPHGYLLVVNKADLTIIQAGENITELLGKPVKDSIGEPLSAWLDARTVEEINTQFNRNTGERLPFVFKLSGTAYPAIIQAAHTYLIVEIAKEQIEEQNNFFEFYQELKYIMTAMEKAGTTKDACLVAAKELKRLSGFDKVMIYRFDESWNGDVIAEEMEPGMEAYMGLKFPASDIPKQARDLYRKMPYRLIPDIHYEPVRLYPVINKTTNAFTDLSLSNLRSVAAVHLQYLSNMQVVASMSTRILKGGQLWGLIACHHRTAKFLSAEMCALFELVSGIISAKIAAVHNEDALQYKNGRSALHARLVEEMYKEESLGAGLYQNSAALLQLLNAGGAAMAVNGGMVSLGKTPQPSDIEDLMMWLQSKNITRLYAASSLASEYEPAENFAETASGLLAIPVQPEKGIYLLAFRPEAEQEIAWGGNPSEAVNFEADGKKYHPRASFKIWKQAVKQTALPWQEDELEAAEVLRGFIIEYMLNKG